MSIELLKKQNELNGLFNYDKTKSIPTTKKVAIIESILINARDEKNGILIFEPMTLSVNIKLQIFSLYTDAALTDDFLNEIDYLDTIGLYEKLVEENKDVQRFLDLLEQYKENELKTHNSVEAQINKFLQLIITKIPNTKQIKEILVKASENSKKSR